MLAYKKVADMYPDSVFAGTALDKVANYYISAKDYDRAIELMDARFSGLPRRQVPGRHAHKWEVAAYRKGDFATAKAKAEQLLSEYPTSKSAEKARKDLKRSTSDSKARFW